MRGTCGVREKLEREFEGLERLGAVSPASQQLNEGPPTDMGAGAQTRKVLANEKLGQRHLRAPQ